MPGEKAQVVLIGGRMTAACPRGCAQPDVELVDVVGFGGGVTTVAHCKGCNARGKFRLVHGCAPSGPRRAWCGGFGGEVGRREELSCPACFQLLLAERGAREQPDWRPAEAISEDFYAS